jgi:hypothetical protein
MPRVWARVMEKGYNHTAMRKLTRFSALAVSLLLLAIPAAGACDELMSGMPECSPGGATQASASATCHGARQALMDCCVTRSSGEPERAIVAERSTALFALEVSSSGPAKMSVVDQQHAATDKKPPGWRAPARYALFSSYLI